jgi:hypothetical protein
MPRPDTQVIPPARSELYTEADVLRAAAAVRAGDYVPVGRGGDTARVRLVLEACAPGVASRALHAAALELEGLANRARWRKRRTLDYCAQVVSCRADEIGG